MSFCSTTKRGLFSEYWWNHALTFKMPKVVVLQIWQLGLINRVLQVGVLIYLFWSIISERSWAYKEVPSTTVNAWIESGAAVSSWASTTSAIGDTYRYCNNASFEFVYSAEFNYSNSRCSAINAFEVATKLPGTVVLSTVYLDVSEEGWDCSAGDATTRAATCLADGGTLQTFFGTQCTCVSRRTTYPVGTEDMMIAFDHQYFTTETMKGLSGSSQVATDGLSSTTIEFVDGRSVAFPPGNTVRLSLGDWLAAGGISLDAPNDNVGAAMNNPSQQPYFRTTGAVILVDLEYSNVPEGQDSPELNHREVRAKIVPTVEKGWAGLAVKAPIYENLPTGPEGRKSYKTLYRYSQGVVFKFTGKGFVYQLDIPYLITTVTSSIVLLSVAATITGAIATFFWPAKRMIRNKTQEQLSIKTRLAEIALKAVSYALTFSILGGNDGKVDTSELSAALHKANVPVTGEEAKMMANLIISHTNMMHEEQDRDMDFEKFMSGLEAGNMISFSEFKEMLAVKCKELDQRKSAFIRSSSSKLEVSTQAV
mmetsp:Transcript_49329/g.128696  ORF Transcript_49329/g.128696 Transcript_49329/m.128696 type:complete len:537 (-) Transcript_49329:426-2036(-)|eukprot:CAMPEP_0115839978 /NCGR_PEP_ID=MMETSP0287-20121206/6535_1 /TAXON_ID=412157 /ORGANISM="Chrysochromulina rotalis, Strain UIO044" /LENGTH=536 /DNA_ID=CAMNT_0003293577 /DNA_START=15 /DNA_END=1625 /DNA_ORIENTATION=-